ncbi:MAG: tripartite tricarboxylate transporter TctB family protein [Propioniciclava sp.]|uniref:tripartite tricarboxylate transporter TctB family protein n=1 Tax=Propioniciclava sp. TaxID=2038686 RepID=UPI0039E599EF
MSADKTDTAEQRPDAAPTHPAPQHGILIIAGILVAIAGLMIYGNLTMKVSGNNLFGPQAFPWIVIAVCLVAAVSIVIQQIRHPRPVPSAPQQDSFSGVSVVHDPFDETIAPQLKADAAEAPAGVNWVKLATALGVLIAFTLIVEPVGWLISATLLFAGMAFALGSKKLLPSLIIGLGLASTIQVVFSGLLGMTLPAGLLLLGS